MAKMVTLITTIFKGSSVIQAIKLFSPDKVYFIVDDPIDDIRKNAIEMIKDLFPDIEYGNISAKIYDIVEISMKTIEAIKSENNKIIVNVSEGRKTMSMGLLLGSYVMRKNVESAYYIIEETNQPIKLPLIELKVSPKKLLILNQISNKKINSISDIEKETGLSSSTLYVHLKELRDDGFLTKDNQVTAMGRIVLLNQEK